MSNKKSDILKTIYEEVKGLHKIGLVDATTMRKFDAHCLEPIKEMTGEDVKRIRNKTNASQPVFATYLNVTVSAVKQWELDRKQPSGASLRLLQLIDHEGLSVFESIQNEVSEKKVPKKEPVRVVHHVKAVVRPVAMRKVAAKGRHRHSEKKRG